MQGAVVKSLIFHEANVISVLGVHSLVAVIASLSAIGLGRVTQVGIAAVAFGPF